jgi:hypothetical protein
MLKPVLLTLNSMVLPSFVSEEGHWFKTLFLYFVFCGS